MEEEDVGRPARSARSSGGGSGGMGLGAKVGLVTGLVALALMAVAVLPNLKGGDDGTAGEQALNEGGAAVVSGLAAVESGTWSGSGPTQGSGELLKRMRSNLDKLFGDRASSWFDEQVNSVRKVDPNLDEDEKRDQQKRAVKFEDELEKLAKGSGEGSGDPVARARDVLKRALGDYGSFDVSHAWVREGHADSGKVLVTTVPDNSPVQVDMSRALRVGATVVTYADGTLGGSPVRVFARRAGNLGGTPVTVYAALFRNQPAGGGSGGSNVLGLLMLIAAPLVVGFTGYALANGSAEHIRGLAREIDRLGTSGDPGRSLRVQGAEASAVARAVERMVGNLEFRQQHAGPAAQGASGQSATWRARSTTRSSTSTRRGCPTSRSSTSSSPASRSAATTSSTSASTTSTWA
jgi:hypothetical protein